MPTAAIKNVVGADPTPTGEEADRHPFKPCFRNFCRLSGKVGRVLKWSSRPLAFRKQTYSLLGDTAALGHEPTSLQSSGGTCQAP